MFRAAVFIGDMIAAIARDIAVMVLGLGADAMADILTREPPGVMIRQCNPGVFVG
jgi:hypothetical protein